MYISRRHANVNAMDKSIACCICVPQDYLSSSIPKNSPQGLAKQGGGGWGVDDENTISLLKVLIIYITNAF